MNYEQKYKEALEKARDMLYYKRVRQDDMEYLFPELAESKDERIRKAIIAYIDHEQHCGVSNADMIAWLEKQGEKLDADKVIEWLKTKVYDDSTYGRAMIEQFKKDLAL